MHALSVWMSYSSRWGGISEPHPSVCSPHLLSADFVGSHVCMLLVWMGWVAGLTWGGIVEAPPLSAHLTHLLNPDLKGRHACSLHGLLDSLKPELVQNW